ncbi:GLNA, glutamine synthase [Phaeodactylum tricornutum CCAP 1055/1]|jgi:glutamine synthetase|uniref:GLNA, glutamine synthase n=1 Tax=Phaeodactylum tricornutum (strain CCAP 1055/1) TaxID=556484 RepID=B7G6Q6_PHATC|nr:GLNA, glutamine synthase [Phaeodactylum tricornutum CCAP 1055/1]EEC45634.1 GLNA, glutamine synthase [Phaeodactylum tricornutum CCAP 1055/1]|eukprot:XP_002182898.1 GLNA, glutamine synthase [Phaeodactylum tricornutum CCAP 1055/1]
MFASRAAVRHFVRRETSRCGIIRTFANLDQFNDFGKHVFTGKIADQYLAKHGGSGDMLKDPTWVKKHSDTVAMAVFDWAIEHGANVYCHWFQPMASSGVRHGLTGQVHNMMFKFDKNNEIVQDFKGKTLTKGETDGSSYPNGGLRSTHAAGGYIAVDTSSPIFLRGDTIFIPSVLVSFYGAALDEKTPLLRANAAIDRHGSRLLKHLGLNTDHGIQTNIGLEQEIFFVSRDQYYRRPDLQLTGRTLIGKSAPRGQEMSDHYMAPLSSATAALACMQDIQDECWRIGIPLKTRHREVAPNQFEFAPLYGTNTTQIDQNIMVMQIIEEVAAKYGLAALLQEKPFDDVNGSGKHNNWSIATRDGVNVLDPDDLAKASGNDFAFPIIMAAIISAVDEHGDLMRMSISSPGNDFRLGACEAPPAIVSTYLGKDMSDYIEAFMNGSAGKYNPTKKLIDLGTFEVIPFEVPAEDRNRTSPFPYGGARFEFRAVGSSQNPSMVNTVLNTIAAEKFAEFADRIEAGEDAVEIARSTLKKHWKVVFNGDNYDEENQKMLTERGLWRIDSGVEAIARLTHDKNIALFEKMGVMTKDECTARQDILHEHYTGTVVMEALCMIDLLNQHIVPDVKEAGIGPLAELETFAPKLKTALAEIAKEKDSYKKAQMARVLRLETMIEIREVCDEAEEVVPAKIWSLATYKELLFLDSHTSQTAMDPMENDDYSI